MTKALLIIATFYVGETDPSLFAPLRAYSSIDACEEYAAHWHGREGTPENGKIIDHIVTGCMAFVPEQLVEFLSTARPFN